LKSSQKGVFESIPHFGCLAIGNPNQPLIHFQTIEDIKIYFIIIDKHLLIQWEGGLDPELGFFRVVSSGACPLSHCVTPAHSLQIGN
jgi:hypothetical protein